MVIIQDYDFLEELVKNGLADKNQKFLKGGFCLADNKEKPNHVFVFHFMNEVIWCSYGWTRKKNKSLLNFYKEVEKLIFSFNKPILRAGKNKDFKNHTKFYGIIEGHKVYQFVRSF